MEFSQFVDAYQIDVHRYCLRLSGNRADADDLFQETFLRAFRAFGRLRPDSNHRAWVFRIATNVFLNHRRTHARRAEVPLEIDASDQGSGGADPDPLAVRAMLREVSALPRRQRAAFVLRKLHGLPYGQVAKSLDCTSAAARANVYQAVKRLRRALAATTESEGGAK